MPDQIHDAQAQILLQGVDLGDWSVLIADTEDDLAEVYGDGLAEGLRLTGMGVDLDQVHQRALEWARERAASMVTMIEENTRDMLRSTVAQAIEEGWSANRLAEEIVASAGFSDDRAQMVARSELLAANNQGNLAGYKDAARQGVNVKKSWESAGDDLVSEECQENEDEGPIELDDVFPSGDDAPPLHPNAVFDGGSFVPYGRLEQALRSRYDGPAVTITALLCKDNLELAASNTGTLPDLSPRHVLSKHSQRFRDLLIANRRRRFVGVRSANISFTIGPNHPVLTRRGFVVASELREGDQLLYDERVEFPAAGVEFDFEQVPLIEDAFEAILRRFGNVTIATPRSYFHGDKIFTCGEVNAVRPTRDLLPVFDPCGIEHLCKCDFMWTYPEAEHVASCGACLATFDRVFLTASCGVGSCCDGSALLQGGRCPPFFKLATITSWHIGSYAGWAFDASTSTGLYNYGGVVVKNCRCAIVPYLPDEDEEEEE